MMSSQPFIFIGLPVYNAERYVAGVIESHLGQTHSNFELVISDNASTDATPEICARYASMDRRIRVVRSPTNRGLSWNHSRLVDLAHGAYFRWGAADDLLSPGLLEEAVGILESNPATVLCVPRAKNIDGDGAVTASLPRTLDLPIADTVERVKAVLTRGYQMVFPQGLMRLGVLQETRLKWDYFGWDYVLLLELALRGQLRQTDKEFLLRRLHPNQASRIQRDANAGVARIEPTFSARWVFPHWRWQRERFRAVADSPLATDDKRRLYAFLAKQTWWARDELVRDLTMNLRLAVTNAGELPL
jgi:glycosyltransferase involved in cell wall biosynthesis